MLMYGQGLIIGLLKKNLNFMARMLLHYLLEMKVKYQTYFNLDGMIGVTIIIGHLNIYLLGKCLVEFWYQLREKVMIWING